MSKSTPSAATAKARTLLYVHGIGNKPTEDVLKCQWDRALFSFELGERSRLAYWVNRNFYPDPVPITCQVGDTTRVGDEGASVQVRSVSSSKGDELILEEEIAALSTNETESAVLQRLKDEILEQREAPAAGVTAAGVTAAGVQQKVLPLPAPLRRWITRQVTRAFLRDVHEYLFVDERRAAMKNSLRERLEVGGGPFVVIAHSQGSMIAYDVLEELGADANVALFVTIGSPLGLTEVRDQLKKLKKTKLLKVPAGVQRWVNVADPLDPVCLDKGLSGEFSPKRFVDDRLHWNRDSPRDPHSATGYLTLSAVQHEVQQAVDISLFQPVSRFVVSRDLSRDLETQALRRHPVLIEVTVTEQSVFSENADAKHEVVSWLRTHAGREPDAKPSATEVDETLRIEILRHYIAAELTRKETELLASNLKKFNLKVNHIWKNSRKRGLVTTSINTVQARPAHLGYGATGAGIVWAILDSGIMAGHPHFKRFQNIKAQYDCTVRGPLSPDGEAPDKNGHGTHVAGIIAGSLKTKDADGREVEFSGMAPAAELAIYKVLDDAGNGYDAWIIKALDHIAAINEAAGRLLIHGVNLSLGGSYDPSIFGCGHTPLCVELRRLWNQGVVVVIAAGNEGFAVLEGAHGEIDANMDLSIGDPANLDEAIAVGSVNKSNPHTYGISYFSSRGPTADGRMKPDLVAPGERILSCRHDFAASPSNFEDLYVEMSGTSMAAPHVSGIVASYLSSRAEFIGFPTKLKKILLDHCTDLGRDPMHQGRGMPNLVKMLMGT